MLARQTRVRSNKPRATNRGAPAKYPGDLVCIGRSAAPRLRHIQRRSGCRRDSGVIRSPILGSIKCPRSSALIADLCARARRSQQSALVLRLGIVRPSDQGTPRNARDRSEVRMRLHDFVRFRLGVIDPTRSGQFHTLRSTTRNGACVSAFSSPLNRTTQTDNEPNEALERSRLSVTISAISSLREGTDRASQPARSV